MDARQLLKYSMPNDPPGATDERAEVHSDQDETDYAVLHPRILADDDGDCEDTATLTDNPTLPVYYGKNIDYEGVGKDTTPGKGKRSEEHLQPERQKLLHGGRSCNALNFIPFLIYEDHALYEMVLPLIVPG